MTKLYNLYTRELDKQRQSILTEVSQQRDSSITRVEQQFEREIAQMQQVHQERVYLAEKLSSILDGLDAATVQGLNIEIKDKMPVVSIIAAPGFSLHQCLLDCPALSIQRTNSGEWRESILERNSPAFKGLYVKQDARNEHGVAQWQTLLDNNPVNIVVHNLSFEVSYLSGQRSNIAGNLAHIKIADYCVDQLWEHCAVNGVEYWLHVQSEEEALSLYSEALVSVQKEKRLIDARNLFNSVLAPTMDMENVKRKILFNAFFAWSVASDEQDLPSVKDLMLWPAPGNQRVVVIHNDIQWTKYLENAPAVQAPNETVATQRIKLLSERLPNLWTVVTNKEQLYTLVEAMQQARSAMLGTPSPETVLVA